ncbi:MAG: helix-turn-helix domain containing protein [Candidatus Pacebacteria bacterium]|jgi:transposase|nr:helix-turn-helix domain containing protein [Candidatus Paceibacterota bacterium]
MARFKDRERALVLRKQGLSYSQIGKILKVGKSTLSTWLKDHPLPKERIKELRDCNEQRIEKFRETMRRKREKRLQETFEIQRKKILPITRREFFLSGLTLYWGEGTKSRMDSLGISNSNPAVIRFFIYWLIKILSVPKKEIKIQLCLYDDMNIAKEIRYWSDTLEIPENQFNRPYVKKTSSKRINHKGGFSHGTCQAKIGNTPLAEKILMSIRVISEQYS